MSLLPLTYLLFQGDLSRFYLSLILIRFLHGIGLAICFTSAFTFIADIVPAQRLNEGIGMFGVTGLTGLAIGPVIAETIIQTFGFSAFFLTAGGLATLGLLLHLPLPESYVHVSHEASQSFFSVLINRRVFTVALLALLFGFGLAASSGFVAPFAKEHDVALISLYFLFYSSAAVITRLLGGRLADRIGEEQIIPYALILTGTGLLILTFLGGSVVLVLSGLISGFGHGFLFPCLNWGLHRRDRCRGIYWVHYAGLHWRMGRLPGDLLCCRSCSFSRSCNLQVSNNAGQMIGCWLNFTLLLFQSHRNR
jgi:predicted MFS family arabinose efflux permease